LLISPLDVNIMFSSKLSRYFLSLFFGVIFWLVFDYFFYSRINHVDLSHVYYNEEYYIELDEIKKNMSSGNDLDLKTMSIKKYKQEDVIVINKDETLSSALASFGINNQDIVNLLNKIKSETNLNSLKIGQGINVFYDSEIRYQKQDYSMFFPEIHDINEVKSLNQLSMKIKSEEKILNAVKSGSEFIINSTKIKTHKNIVNISGTIDNSLFGDAIQAGASSSVVARLISEYSYDVDFQRDIRKGDKFEILYEEFKDESGDKLKDGRIIYANLNLSKKDNKIFNYKGSFYDAKGKELKKGILRTPVDGARISSKFSSARKHPVLGFTRKHEGVDFAAPIGTPIYAAGDGVIEFVGKKGGYGNFVTVRHNKQFKTNYAHMSRFANIKVGSKVRQKQVIGYIGMTGITSGPHLHFEVVKDGKKINPASQKFNTGKELSGKELKEFNEYSKIINQSILSDKVMEKDIPQFYQ
jgi:murein DD-endopeptidase MepM/ murein hydrolase activator NlpD